MTRFLADSLTDGSKYDLAAKQRVAMGYYGDIYRTTHRGTGAAVEIRELRPLDVSEMQCVLQELELVAKTDHPALLPLLGFRIAGL